MLVWGLAVRRLGAVLCGVGAVVSAASAAEPDVAPKPQSWNVTFATDVRYYSWTGDRGYPTTVNGQAGSGSEIYAPVALQITGKPAEDFKLSLLVRGGFVHAQQG